MFVHREYDWPVGARAIPFVVVVFSQDSRLALLWVFSFSSVYNVTFLFVFSSSSSS